MKIELNYKEYISELCPKHAGFRCLYCTWKFVPEQYCIKFCRPGYILRTSKIITSVFHL